MPKPGSTTKIKKGTSRRRQKTPKKTSSPRVRTGIDKALQPAGAQELLHGREDAPVKDRDTIIEGTGEALNDADSSASSVPPSPPTSEDESDLASGGKDDAEQALSSARGATAEEKQQLAQVQRLVKIEPLSDRGSTGLEVQFFTAESDALHGESQRRHRGGISSAHETADAIHLKVHAGGDADQESSHHQLHPQLASDKLAQKMGEMGAKWNRFINKKELDYSLKKMLLTFKHYEKNNKLKAKHDADMQKIADETCTFLDNFVGQKSLAANDQLRYLTNYERDLSQHLKTKTWKKVITGVLVAAVALIGGAFLGAVIGGLIGLWSGPGAAVFGVAGAAKGVASILGLLTGSTSTWASLNGGLIFSRAAFLSLGITSVAGSGKAICEQGLFSTKLKRSVQGVRNTALKEIEQEKLSKNRGKSFHQIKAMLRNDRRGYVRV